MDWGKILFDIAKVDAQKHGAAISEPVRCEDCWQYDDKITPTTETWTIPVAPYAEHYCEACADKRRERSCA